MIQQTQEILDVVDRVQYTKLVINNVSETESAVWNDPDVQVAVYYVWSEVNCYFRVKSFPGGTAVTADTGCLLLANNPICIVIGKGQVFAALSSSGAGNVRFFRLNRLGV